MLELWQQRIPEVGTAEAVATRAEDGGWDGVSFTDSQNLIGDPFVAIALAARATTTLRFMTGVTNVATRHPAALATVAATVQEESAGRMVLGVGRGDTALFHLGRKPQPVTTFRAKLADLQTYLAGETIDLDGRPSRIRWLERARAPKVPVDIAAAGPRVITLAAELAERITFAVGADAERLAWGLDIARSAARAAGRESPSFGSYVVVGCHPDRALARDIVRGALAAFIHFSAMPGSTGAGVAPEDRERFEELGRRYDSDVHLMNRADHTSVVDDELVEKYAVIGTPDECVARLSALAGLGLERFVITGATLDADREAGRLAARLVRDEVLPALREAAR